MTTVFGIPRASASRGFPPDIFCLGGTPAVFEFLNSINGRGNCETRSDRYSIAVISDFAFYLLGHFGCPCQSDEAKIYHDNERELVSKALHDAFKHVLSKETIIYRDVSPRRQRLHFVDAKHIACKCRHGFSSLARALR